MLSSFFVMPVSIAIFLGRHKALSSTFQTYVSFSLPETTVAAVVYICLYLFSVGIL